GAPLVLINGKVFSERIARIVDETTRIEFVLVRDNPGWQGGPRTFYIMQNKVWNSLYRQFSGEDENSPRAQLGDRLPAVDMTVVDAFRFAQWLCGPAGNLPSKKQ